MIPASLSIFNLDLLSVEIKHSISALVSYRFVDFFSCLFLQIKSKPVHKTNVVGNSYIWSAVMLILSTLSSEMEWS